MCVKSRGFERVWPRTYPRPASWQRLLNS